MLKLRNQIERKYNLQYFSAIKQDFFIPKIVEKQCFKNQKKTKVTNFQTPIPPRRVIRKFGKGHLQNVDEIDCRKVGGDMTNNFKFISSHLFHQVCCLHISRVLNFFVSKPLWVSKKFLISKMLCFLLILCTLTYQGISYHLLRPLVYFKASLT